MNKNEYKKAVDQIDPDESLREKVWQGLGSKSSSFTKIRYSTLAFVSIFILSVVAVNTLLNSGVENKQFDMAKSSKMEKKVVSEEFIGYDGNVETSEYSAFDKSSNKMSADNAKNGSALKDNSIRSEELIGSADSYANADLSMFQTGTIGRFEFVGRTYIEDIDNYFYNIKNLKFKKLGEINISFFKGHKGYEPFKDEPFHPNKKDLISYPNGYEIYSVKGYDPKYRLMIYGESNGEKWGSIYNSFGDKQIEKGEDLFGNLYLKGNIKVVRWKSIHSWQRKIEVYKPVEQSVFFENFIDKLYSSKRIEYHDLPKQEIIDNIENCKIVYITMKNNIIEQIWLYPDTKNVEYKVAGIRFEVDDKEFDAFFETLK